MAEQVKPFLKRATALLMTSELVIWAGLFALLVAGSLFVVEDPFAKELSRKPLALQAVCVSGMPGSDRTSVKVRRVEDVRHFFAEMRRIGGSPTLTLSGLVTLRQHSATLN